MGNKVAKPDDSVRVLNEMIPMILKKNRYNTIDNNELFVNNLKNE